MNDPQHDSRTVRARGTAVTAVALLACAALLSMPASGLAANAYNQTFDGQAKCLECHGNDAGRWQVGRYLVTAHAKFVTDVSVSTSSLVPIGTSTWWPSPAFGGGISVGASDIGWQLGAPGVLHEYVSIFKNDASHQLSTGVTITPVSGPADDMLMPDPLNFDPIANTWVLQKPISMRTYFQGCGGCHFLGVTRPSDVTYTLPSGAQMTHSTETSYSGFGIQCETCHGTGRVATSQETTHWTATTEIVRTKRVLKSQTCGQCHISGSSKQKNWAGKAFSQPNGFTTDQNLEDYFDVLGADYVQTSPVLPAPAIPSSDTKFYPTGHNKGMGHGYYNEWQLSAHARSLHYKDGAFWTGSPRESCLPCHSGEAFLKSIGYGSDGPNDIGILPSSLASDTLNVECAICHTVHAKTGDALGLRLPEGQLCEQCHTARMPVGEEAPSGAHERYSTKEMIAGYGLIGVPKPAKRFMGSAGCVDCHMPRTYKERVSHNFKPMLPGDAETFGVQEEGDSCTPCHRSETRATLQGDIDTWQSDIRARMDVATAALVAAKSRPASSTVGGQWLCNSAQTNIWFCDAEGSDGVHNYPYAKAGLDKAAYFAKAVGASFPSFTLSAFDSYHGVSMAFGRLEMGDGSYPASEQVAIEAKPGGATSWTVAGTVKTDANGDFACAVYPTGTTQYRARWTPGDATTAVYSVTRSVTFGSKTSIHLSSSRLARYRTVTITGSVSPNHAGKGVSVHYRIGTGSWRTLTTRTLNASSAYSASMRLNSRGYYYFHTHFGGDPSHASSVSSTARVQVY